MADEQKQQDNGGGVATAKDSLTVTDNRTGETYEVEVGKVAEVLDNYREHIFDGLVIEGSDGARRFVDAPEVERTAERAVTLSITASEVAKLSPEQGSGSIGGIARRLFGRR